MRLCLRFGRSCANKLYYPLHLFTSGFYNRGGKQEHLDDFVRIDWNDSTAQHSKLYEINTQGLAAPSFSECELQIIPFQLQIDLPVLARVLPVLELVCVCVSI
jgi:hypothetical protein